MSTITEAIQQAKSGVAFIAFYNNEERIVSSGSGFLCKNRLISNNHIFFDPEGHPLDETTVKVFFGDNSQQYVLSQSYNDFMEKLESGSDQANYDYAIFSSLDLSYEDRFLFDLGSHEDIQEGQQVLIMGYPFGQRYLTSHVGHVSSIYQQNSVNIIQLDASTNSGNSGGPVIDLESRKVIGVITRKQTGLAKDFDKLIRSFEDNLDALSQSRASIKISGVDPIETFKITQNQMKVISLNIKRSANTGIGFAFSCEKLQQENFYK